MKKTRPIPRINVGSDPPGELQGRATGPAAGDSTKRPPTAKPEKPGTVKHYLTPSDPCDQALKALIREQTKPARRQGWVVVEQRECPDSLWEQILKTIPKAIGIAAIVGLLITGGYVIANPIIIDPIVRPLRLATSK